SALIPYDLLWIQEANPQQPGENLGRVNAGMPHVRDLDAGDQLERFRPIRTCVAGNLGLGVTRGALFHVTRFSRSAAVESGAIPPLAVERNAVRRIGHHQARL